MAGFLGMLFGRRKAKVIEIEFLSVDDDGIRFLVDGKTMGPFPHDQKIVSLKGHVFEISDVTEDSVTISKVPEEEGGHGRQGTSQAVDA